MDISRGKVTGVDEKLCSCLEIMRDFLRGIRAEESRRCKATRMSRFSAPDPYPPPTALKLLLQTRHPEDHCKVGAVHYAAEHAPANPL